MDVLEELITIDRTADQPVYLQISNSFIHSIRRGRLRSGLKLPGSRKMADLLQINRMTMVAAYDELQAQGWIECIPRKGTFVAQNLTEVRPKHIAWEKEKPVQIPKTAGFPFFGDTSVSSSFTRVPGFRELVINDGFPDVRLAPTELLMRAMRRISGRPTFGKHLRYGSSSGTKVLRETLAVELTDTRLFPVRTKNIMITRGAQMGLYLAARLVIRTGDHVIVGEPGFFGANQTFLQQGAVLERVPVDEGGMDVDLVEELCKEKKIKLLYVVPHHHHPTTVTLMPGRRIKLLELAERYNFAIIEDDYDYDFHYSGRPMLPMASLDDCGNVIYIGTLSKTMAPGIRIGFMAGAEDFIQAASQFRRTMDWQGDHLLEAAIAEFYRDGTINRHIKKSVKLYRKRRDHFCTLLSDNLGDHVSFRIPDGGMSVWAKFRGIDLKELSRKAAKKGLTISDGIQYNTHTQNYNSLRMGFASLNIEEQGRAVELLAECIRDM